MLINVILAACNGGGIGYKGSLPWVLKEDLRRFKKLTSGTAVIMGRKTWESLPRKPLPNRLNIVLTKNEIEGVKTAKSLKEALEIAASYNSVFIIGGSSVYSEAFDLCHAVYYTKVLSPDFLCDVWIDEERIRRDFELKEEGELREELGCRYRFLVYERN